MSYDELVMMQAKALEEMAEVLEEYMSQRAEIIGQMQKYLTTIRQCLGEMKLLHKSIQIRATEEGEVVVISITAERLFITLDDFLNEYHYEKKNKEVLSDEQNTKT